MNNTPPGPGGVRYRRRALWVLAALVAMEVMALLPYLQAAGPSGGDAREYDALAHSLIERHCYSNLPDCEPSLLRTPGYPVFLAAVYEFGGGTVSVRLLQFAILALTAFLVFETVSVYGSGTAALLAGILTATFVPLALAPLYHMPETLATGAAVATVWAAAKLPGWRPALLFGLFGGLGYLVRPTLALLPLALGLGLLLSRRVPRRQLAVAALVCLATLAPTVVRNSLIEHRLALVGSPPGWAVYLSALQWEGRVTYDLTSAPFLPFTHERDQRITTLYRSGETLRDATAAVDRDYLRRGREEFGKIPWYRFVAGWPVRMYHLWGGHESELGLSYLFLIEPAQWLAMVILSAVGLWQERRRLLAQYVLWLPIVCLSLFHTYFHVEPRYALMGWPFLIVYAGFGGAAILGRMEWRKKQPGAAHSAAEGGQP